jgi:hypothetical protein
MRTHWTAHQGQTVHIPWEVVLTCSTRALRAFGSLTSATHPCTWSPSPSSSLIAQSRSFCERQQVYTEAPMRASSSTIARPMPARIVLVGLTHKVSTIIAPEVNPYGTRTGIPRLRTLTASSDQGEFASESISLHQMFCLCRVACGWWLLHCVVPLKLGQALARFWWTRLLVRSTVSTLDDHTTSGIQTTTSRESTILSC